MFAGRNEWLVALTLLSCGAASVGCGGGNTGTDQGPDDQGSQVDANRPDTGSTDAGTTTLLACERDDLFMSGIDLAAKTVRLTNPTGADITIGGTNYQLCQGPGLYSALPAGVVPAGGSLVVAIPSSLTIDTVSGTLALYNPGSFTTRDAMLDYVCWGDGAGTPRLNIAQRVGTDGTVLWDDGGCVQLAGSTDLYLRTGTPGNTASDYRNSPSNVVCMVSSTDAGVDAGVTDMGVDAGPVAILECERTTLIIESVNTQTGEITLYNPTGSTITTTGDYQLCQGPGNYAAVPAHTYAAYSRHTFSAPGTITVGADATLALYSSASFGSRNAMVDYMCWGTGGTRPRLTEAQTVGTDGTALWSGGCTPAAANATIYRAPGTEGNAAGDYTTVAPAPAIDCNPVI
ncbi:MAG: hypothetical protein H6725_03700 [Sandaracinaceae bacterium]|nr:hypothetical protein [Sandaracinaceae bacterium]